MPRVKICGITCVEDAQLALDAGADLLGLIFCASPRRVTLETAAAVAAATDSRLLVGVFADPDLAEVRRILDVIPLGAVQLHGAESSGFVESLSRHVHVIKAVWRHADAVRALRAGCPILLDAPPARRGSRADWELGRELAHQTSLYLAGGLNAANVTRAVAEVRPFAVDVCSGVEESPGRKSAAAVRAFIRAAKGGCDVEQLA